MSQKSTIVSLHPYFKPHAGKVEAFRALLPAFIEKSTNEEKSLYYDFTFSGEEFFCREGYIGAEGVLTHLANVGDLLNEALKVADLTRLEVHGSAEELEKLKPALSGLNPTLFVYECGVVK
jgi:quinol monooxygenase YgiN